MTTVEFSYSIIKGAKALKPYALRLTDDMEEAKDLIQETLLKAFANRDKFAKGTNAKAWLYTIMKNTFFTGYRRLARRNAYIDDTSRLHYINSDWTSTQNPDVIFYAREDIQQALGRLDEVYRMPFVMYFQGFKYREIALELKLPVGTVKNRIHIARKVLQHKLKIYRDV